MPLARERCLERLRLGGRHEHSSRPFPKLGDQKDRDENPHHVDQRQAEQKVDQEGGAERARNPEELNDAINRHEIAQQPEA